MSDLVIALAGGTIGSVATWLIGWGAYFRALPSQVEEHDRLVRERDEDLEQWVADDHLRLTRELAGITNRMASPDEGQGSQLYSGAHGRALAHAKERALHAYRDQERSAQRFVAEIAAREGWLHRDHRRQFGKPKLGLNAPSLVRPVLDRWRDLTWGHPPGVAPAGVTDPTQRTLDTTVAAILGELQAAANAQ
jgi:hypothetical protein